MMSLISCKKRNKNNEEESSDSNGSIYTTSQPNKRTRLDRFKGVVPQQNGHWGAQIYTNHQRIWLGTFKSEIEAAMAYDSAAIRLRTGDSHRNFPWTSISHQELKFQSLFTTDILLNMIRDGSYPSKFDDFLRSQKGQLDIGLTLSSTSGKGEFSCTLLFQKELTLSDVGKLNRLVIPKRFAVKYFPSVPTGDSNLACGVAEEVRVSFYDRNMAVWKFRYCYWKSSQSYVFTRGWNRFVKEKGLSENDTIAFYMYESSRDGGRFGKSYFVIDVAKKDGSRINGPDDNREMNLRRNVEEKIDVEDNKRDGNKDVNLKRNAEEKIEVENHNGGFGGILGSNSRKETKGFRLFGVQIELS